MSQIHSQCMYINQKKVVSTSFAVTKSEIKKKNLFKLCFTITKKKLSRTQWSILLTIFIEVIQLYITLNQDLLYPRVRTVFWQQTTFN